MEGTNYSLSDMAAACGGCNGNNANMMWNNPIIWALLFGGGYGWNRGNCGGGCQGLQDAEIMSQLNAIRQTMADNQNANALGAGIAGNHDLLHNIAGSMNMGFAGTNAAVNCASNANLLSQKDMQAMMQSCCCDQKQLSQQLGFANQLGQKDIQNAMLMGFDRTNTGLERGFSAVAYESQKQTCDIINSGKDNTQRIIDTMNLHWNQDLQQRYNDARLELSQLRQNATLIDAMKEVAAG